MQPRWWKRKNAMRVKDRMRARETGGFAAQGSERAARGRERERGPVPLPPADRHAISGGPRSLAPRSPQRTPPRDVIPRAPQRTPPRPASPSELPS